MNQQIMKSINDINLKELTAGKSFHSSPDRWEDQVLYFLMLDRFSDGNENGYKDNSGEEVKNGQTPKYDPSKDYRDKGPETYGSFLIRLDIVNTKGDTLHTFNDHYLKNIRAKNIHNKYINNIHAGANSLVVPLGSKATIEFNLPAKKKLKKEHPYKFIFTDISGKRFVGKNN